MLTDFPMEGAIEGISNQDNCSPKEVRIEKQDK